MRSRPRSLQRIVVAQVFMSLFMSNFMVSDEVVRSSTGGGRAVWNWVCHFYVVVMIHESPADNSAETAKASVGVQDEDKAK